MTQTQIAIISHERADRLVREALSWIDRLGIPHSLITVFVAPDQKSWYQMALPGDVNLVESVVGSCANRNFMVNYYDPGTNVISVDDDVKNIRHMAGGQWYSIKPMEWEKMVAFGFALMDLFKGGLWGLTPIQNDLWARQLPAYQVGMPKVDSPFFGFRTGVLDLTVPEDSKFEDVERSCRVVEQGFNVIRLNRYSHLLSTSVKGGRGNVDRNWCADARRIEKLYPRLVQHGEGYLKQQSQCLPKPRRGVYVPTPESIEQVEAMWARVNSQPAPEVEETVHG